MWYFQLFCRIATERKLSYFESLMIGFSSVLGWHCEQRFGFLLSIPIIIAVVVVLMLIHKLMSDIAR